VRDAACPISTKGRGEGSRRARGAVPPEAGPRGCTVSPGARCGRRRWCGGSGQVSGPEAGQSVSDHALQRSAFSGLGAEKTTLRQQVKKLTLFCPGLKRIPHKLVTGFYLLFFFCVLASIENKGRENRGKTFPTSFFLRCCSEEHNKVTANIFQNPIFQHPRTSGSVLLQSKLHSKARVFTHGNSL
jgi:hypothetical protein